MEQTTINTEKPTVNTMTSLQIAEIAGKRHYHLLRSIRKMENAWHEVTGTKFGLSEYTDPTGRVLPCYNLTKEESLYIATKFNDKARARLVKRWMELERQNAIKSSDERMRQLRLDMDFYDAMSFRFHYLEFNFGVMKVLYRMLWEELPKTSTSTQLAQKYGVEPWKLNNKMDRCGLIYRTPDGYRPTELGKAMELTQTAVYTDDKGNPARYLTWTRWGNVLIDMLYYGKLTIEEAVMVYDMFRSELKTKENTSLVEAAQCRPPARP